MFFRSRGPKWGVPQGRGYWNRVVGWGVCDIVPGESQNLHAIVLAVELHMPP